jgi:dihydroxy-acid dehydratase
VLRGNLAPDGAIIKPSAATPELLTHRGRAIVFESVEDLHSRIDSVDAVESDVLLLRGCGPKGYPGMPEVGNLPLPRKLLERGVRDMVRVSDARMSGTAYGAVVLHVAPEAAAGGPLGAARTGDTVMLDVERGLLQLEASDVEMRKRLADQSVRPWRAERGYERMYVEHVLQADTGADLDFLVGHSRAGVPRESH